MKKFLSVLLAAVVMLSVCSSFAAIAEETIATTEPVAKEGCVVENIGNITVTKFNSIWQEPTANTFSIITPGMSVSGLYYEKAYAKYNEELGCYEVVEKVANHRAYTQTVAEGYIGICFNYAPLTSAGSDIAKANWYVWQHIRVGDRLYLHNIDLRLQNLSITGAWGTASYKSDSYIEVHTVRDELPTVTPYSNRSIVAQGDSITVGGGWTSVWGDYFSTTVINSGFGGDTATANLAVRYNTYVAAFEPEIVFVSFGINDAFSAAPSTQLMENYKTALRNIYAKNTELGATTVFMTANVIKISAIESGVFNKGDYSSFGGEEAYLDQFINCMRQVADELGCVVIDLYSMWKEEGLSPDNIIDSCHPNGYGYDRNWVVQKDVLLKEMQTICGDDIRVLKGTTAQKAVDGLSECTVTVKDANGNIVTDMNTVLKNGYTVQYTYEEENIGTYTVTVIGADDDYLLGDVNKDGKINSLDAAKILKYDAKLTELAEDELVTADVNGDGKVNSLDAAKILKYDAGLIEEF